MPIVSRLRNPALDHADSVEKYIIKQNKCIYQEADWAEEKC